MIKKVRHIVLIVISIMLLVGGCQAPQNQQKAFQADHSNKPEISQMLGNKMEEKVKAMQEVDQVRTVSLDKKVYMTLTVSGFHRLFLKRIRKDAFDRAKSVDKNATIHVSTDRKVDMELADLQKKIHEGSISKKELNKELKKIEDDMKG